MCAHKENMQILKLASKYLQPHHKLSIILPILPYHFLISGKVKLRTRSIFSPTGSTNKIISSNEMPRKGASKSNHQQARGLAPQSPVPIYHREEHHPASADQMVTIDLSPPQQRVREGLNQPASPTQRISHQAAIRHNVTLADRVYSNVQDAAYQAGFELQNAYKHPHQIPGRLGNAAVGAASGAANISAEVGYSVAAEAAGAGMMVLEGCGRLAHAAGNSAHRVARRAARRASNRVFGIQEQDGGISGGYGEGFENIEDGEADEENYESMIAWPEEEEQQPIYKGYY